jgi:hypothetical protein
MSENYLPTPKPKNQTRRGLLKKGAVTLLGLTAMLQGSSRLLNAEESTAMTIVTLVNVLRSTRNTVCEAAANRLMLGHEKNRSNYDLHLRSANLSIDEIEQIAAAIQAVHNQGGPALHSVSLSYNNLSDQVMMIFLKALPPTLTELGLVQCGLSDTGGEALVAWASGAAKLQMLCVEQNAFSQPIKEQLSALGQQRPGLLVVV